MGFPLRSFVAKSNDDFLKKLKNPTLRPFRGKTGEMRIWLYKIDPKKIDNPMLKQTRY